MTDRDIAELHAEFLVREGFLPKIDDDNDVVFSYMGKTFFIQVDAQDPEFFRLIAPNFWPIESDQERQVAALVASEVNRGLKTAKVFLNFDNTWASVDLFCSPIENYKSVFMRCLDALRTAVNDFSDGMRSAE